MSDYGHFTGGSMSAILGSVSRMAMLAGMAIAVSGFPFAGDAVVDYDFANNRYHGSPITTTRASTGLIDDLEGNWSSVAANTMRRSNKGVLIEEAKTNYIRNNQWTNGVAGSPGTLPTNVLLLAPAGLTRTLAFGTQQGVYYMQVSYEGTTSSAASIVLYPEATTTQAVAATGQIWTHSELLQITSLTPSNLSLSVGISERSGVNAQVAFSHLLGVSAVASKFTRAFYQRTLTHADTVGVVPYVTTAQIPSGTYVNFAFRIALSQIEPNQMTSPIPTTGVAGTRAADVISAPIDGLTAGATGAAVVRPGPTQAAANQSMCVVSSPDLSNRLIMGRTTSATFYSSVISSATVTTIHTNNTVAGSRHGFAAAFAENDRAVSTDGVGVVANTTTATFPAGMSILNIGNNGAGAVIWNGYIERLAFVPRRAPNAEVTRLSQVASWS